MTRTLENVCLPKANSLNKPTDYWSALQLLQAFRTIFRVELALTLGKAYGFRR